MDIVFFTRQHWGKQDSSGLYPLDAGMIPLDMTVRMSPRGHSHLWLRTTLPTNLNGSKKKKKERKKERGNSLYLDVVKCGISEFLPF